MRPPVVHADRGLFALADDTHDAAAGLTAFSHELARPATELSGTATANARRLYRRAALRSLTETRRLTATAAATLLGLLRLLGLTLRNSGRNRNDLEVAAGDRVLVFLSKEALLHEEVDRGREVSGAHLPLIQVHGARVLLAAKDELGFLLALHFVAPHRHRDGHQDHHDPEAHEQRGHGVSALVALTL
jgi:hypothetical protein